MRFWCAPAVALGVALFALGAPGGAVAAPPPRAEAQSYTFAFRDAEITQVVQEVLGAAGVAYAIDPAVSGRLSFRIEQRLTREQLLAAFEAVLSTNGVALVRNGDQLLVTPQSKAKSSAGLRRAADGPGSAGYEAVVIPLAYAEPSEVAKALEAISSSQSVIYVSDRLGLLVLGGSGTQVKAAMETIRVFDQSAFADTRVRWFELQQAQAQTVTAELERIAAGAKLVGVSFVPLRRLNGILVFARSPDSLAEIGKWVSRLDIPGKEASSSLWVYRPHATSAESLARTLNGLLGFQTSPQTQNGASANDPGAPPPTVRPEPASALQGNGATDDQARIGVDKDSNTLIVFASPGRWVQIQRILAEIDRTPKQILIEASILEVTLGKDSQFGVDWSFMSGDLAVSSINSDTGKVAPTFPGLSITYLNSDIQAAVRALGSKTALEVVSAPKIIALDNKTARLQVGDQVPIVTQSSQSRNDSNAALINTVDYRSTGVILTVTPRVTGDNQLVLDVSQEVSNVAKTNTSGIDSPTIQQRRFESTLVMPDGGVVALGGLISRTRTEGNSGIPWLKDIPGVGMAFRSEGKSATRTELIVLLSARIIDDAAEAQTAMASLLADMQELQHRGLLPTKP